MKSRPPLLLVGIVTLYMILEIALFLTGPELVKFVRVGIAAALGFFMLRGSSVAIFIWAGTSVLAAIYGFTWAFKVWQTNPQTAAMSFAFGGLALVQAVYLMFNRTVRAFRTSI